MQKNSRKVTKECLRQINLFYRKKQNGKVLRPGACPLHNYKKVFDSLLDSSFEIRPVIFISHTNETSKSNNTQVVPSIILVKVTNDKT